MNEELLAQWLAERFEISLSETDLARTQALSAIALSELDRYRDTIDFHDETTDFGLVLLEQQETLT